MSTNLHLPPQPVYALFSGGKDSFACAKVLELQGLLRGVVMLDTGISVPEWKESCIKQCRKQLWEPIIIPTPIRFEWFVWKYGFPGPQGHRYAMNYLKGRAVRQFKARYKNESLASGVRTQESGRRKLSSKPISLFEGVTVYAPIIEWTDKMVWEFVREHEYERPESYSKLGISGDCLCGAFAREDEHLALKTHYPECYQRIQKLERECLKSPVNLGSRCFWGWATLTDEQHPDPLESAILDEGENLICHDCAR